VVGDVDVVDVVANVNYASTDHYVAAVVVVVVCWCVDVDDVHDGVAYCLFAGVVAVGVIDVVYIVVVADRNVVVVVVACCVYGVGCGGVVVGDVVVVSSLLRVGVFVVACHCRCVYSHWVYRVRC